jgi:hypothetical protein
VTSEERTREQPGADKENESERGRHNEIGYRNVDEDARHDERGSQGAGPGEPDSREES